jgi:uncharacterized membrane protein YfcA
VIGEPAVPIGSLVLMALLRFLCGAVVGGFIALLLNLKEGGVDRQVATILIIAFGVVAVVLWRLFGIILDHVFRPHNWT